MLRSNHQAINYLCNCTGGEVLSEYSVSDQLNIMRLLVLFMTLLHGLLAKNISIVVNLLGGSMQAKSKQATMLRLIPIYFHLCALN